MNRDIAVTVAEQAQSIRTMQQQVSGLLVPPEPDTLDLPLSVGIMLATPFDLVGDGATVQIPGTGGVTTLWDEFKLADEANFAIGLPRDGIYLAAAGAAFNNLAGASAVGDVLLGLVGGPGTVASVIAQQEQGIPLPGGAFLSVMMLFRANTTSTVRVQAAKTTGTGGPGQGDVLVTSFVVSRISDVPPLTAAPG